jgi:hypothetical protein
MIVMAKIITAGRTDTKDFFEKSGNFDTGVKLVHTPFLVFLEGENAIHVQIAETVERLLIFPDEAPVMAQWQGNDRSDFFRFTVGDYRSYAEEKKKRAEEQKKRLEALFNRQGFSTMGRASVKAK